MEMIEFGNLWDILCESLDFVRDLEGIIDVETLDGDMDMDTSGDISLNRSTGSANDLSFSMNSGANKSSMGEVLNTPTTSLSSLTMRFMPLIECYLSVCSCTLMVPPLPNAFEADESTEIETPKKRGRQEGADHNEPLEVMPAETPTSGLTPVSLTRGDSVIGVALQSAIKQESLPGHRFRLHEAYMMMQLGLKDGDEAHRFKSFIDKNSVLLNMILRQNVHLLETSFSALILVPFCRHRLHFDIKRAILQGQIKENETELFAYVRLSPCTSK